MYQESDYEKFAAMMEEKYPSMFEGSYGGFAIGPGWWPIVESLCAHIQSHVVQSNERRKLLLKSNPYNTPIPDEVPPVVVEQIKEKFGGLRFYHIGGNSRIDGMVTMAEAWAAHTCEECGKLGTLRTGRWIKTLCDEHEAERQERWKNT
jgi:hypothetical protein